MSIFATGFSGVMGKMNETTLEVQQENTNYSLENTIPDSDSPSFSSQSINIKSTKMTIPKGRAGPHPAKRRPPGGGF